MGYLLKYFFIVVLTAFALPAFVNEASANQSYQNEINCLKTITGFWNDNEVQTLYFPDENVAILLSNEEKLQNKFIHVYSTNSAFSVSFPKELIKAQEDLSYQKHISAFRNELYFFSSSVDPTQKLSSALQDSNFNYNKELYEFEAKRHYIKLQLPNLAPMIFNYDLRSNNVYRDFYSKTWDFTFTLNKPNSSYLRQVLHNTLVTRIYIIAEMYSEALKRERRSTAYLRKNVEYYISALEGCKSINNQRVIDAASFTIESLQQILNFQQTKFNLEIELRTRSTKP